MKLQMFIVASLISWICTGCKKPEQAPPPLATLTILHSQEVSQLFRATADSFNQTANLLQDGSRPQIELVLRDPVRSAQELAWGHLKTGAWLAPSEDLVAYSNSKRRNLGAKQIDCRPVFWTPVVYALREQDVERVEITLQTVLWQELEKRIKTASDTNQQRVSLSTAIPLGTSSGLPVLIQLAYLSVPNRDTMLNINPLKEPKNATDLAANYARLSSYAVDDQQALNKMRMPDTAISSIVLTTESELVRQNRAMQAGLVAVYPKEGSYAQHYQLCRSDAEWFTPQQQVIFQLFVEHLLRQDNQAQALSYGFRPVSSGPSDGDWPAPAGTNFHLPKKIFPPAEPAVIDYLLNNAPNWTRPLSLTLVVDTSANMSDTPIVAVKSILNNLVDRLPEDSRMSLLAFDSQVYTLVPLSSDKQALKTGISKLHAAGGSALFDAVKHAVDLQVTDHDLSRRHFILVFSSGRDTSSRTELTTLLDYLNIRLRDHDIQFVFIGIDIGSANFEAIERIVDLTRSTFFHAPTTSVRQLLNTALQEVQPLSPAN